VAAQAPAASSALAAVAREVAAELQAKSVASKPQEARAAPAGIPKVQQWGAKVFKHAKRSRSSKHAGGSINERELEDTLRELFILGEVLEQRRAPRAPAAKAAKLSAPASAAHRFRSGKAVGSSAAPLCIDLDAL